MPEGALTQDDFELVEADVPDPGPGQLLVRTRLISIDAANRAWMQGLTYRSALAARSVMAGLAVSEVVESRDDAFAVGDLVFADSGWQDYAVIHAAQAVRQPRIEPLTHLLSVYGTSTLTAYFGLLRIGLLKAGETTVVSAAGGSVGIAVSQIAKIMGARVVGMAGGPDKCRWLVDEVGLDAALDYKGAKLSDQLNVHVPGGIDVYFDNVGGDILETCLFAMNTGGRIACCGAISSYDRPKPAHGPRGVPGLLITRRLTMRGFLVDDFASEREEALRQIRSWVADGRFRAIEDVMAGIEHAPTALIGQLAGRNRGKLIVSVA